jgi:hypothetical protein
MSYDAGLVARIADLLPQTTAPSARQKNVFGGWGFLVGSSAFVIAWTDGLIVKTPRDEYQAVLATPGVTPFAPGGERPMGTWVVVSAEVIADDPELLEWVQRGLRGIGR